MSSRITSGGAWRAFVCDNNGTLMRDLNTCITNLSGWTLLSAEAINDNGVIVDYGTMNGTTRLFMAH